MIGARGLGGLGWMLLAFMAAGCGDSDPSPGRSRQSEQQRQVKLVLERGRRALLADDGQRACALLSAHGRRGAQAFGRSLGSEDRPKRPGTCRQIVDALWHSEHHPYTDQSYTPDLRSGRIVVGLPNGNRAVARIAPSKASKRPFLAVRVRLVRQHGHWLVDDSDAVPTGD